jgi:hypothetical protein
MMRNTALRIIIAAKKLPTKLFIWSTADCSLLDMSSKINRCGGACRR